MSRQTDPVSAAPRGAPAHISPSSASTYEQCPLRWRFRYIDRLPEPAGAAALVGTFSHLVLERLMSLVPPERTVERARRLASENWPSIASSDDFGELELDQAGVRAFKWRAWRVIEGLWRFEDPIRVDVQSTEQRIHTELDGVPFVGVVDRLERISDELVVTDYKSGRPPSRRFADDKLDQVLLYAAAVHASTGRRPASARLLYLSSASVIEAEATDAAVGTAVERLAGTWRSLSADCASGEFDARPGPLCGWCPHAEQCTSGMREIRRRLDAGTLRADAPAARLAAA